MSRLTATVDSTASQLVIQRRTGCAIARSCRTIRHVNHWYLTSGTPIRESTTRHIFTIRLAIQNSPRDGFINSLSAPVWIAKIAARHARHAAPMLVFRTARIIWPSTRLIITVTRMTVTIPMSIVSRMRILLVVIQRVPADVVAKREVEDKRDERGPPPASVSVKLAARAPRPVAVVINPAAIVIRRPAPRLVTDPRPAVRRAPAPLAVAIRSPIAVDVERA